MARATKNKASKADSGSEAPASIDDTLDGLEAVVAELESGDLPLEEALKKFEDGVRLARQGEKVLEQVEERIEALLADADGTEPFEAHEEETQ
ncbi:MAG: exodeoxyribonuclease VII small subunit [Myxococcota bacterium]